jgi:hypothetical protein
MKRLRFSVAGLMAVILLFAVGMAALRAPTDLWASGMFTAAITLFSTSILGAMATRGSARLSWPVVAVFGWIYLIIAFAPRGVHPIEPPRLLPSALLESVQDSVVSDGKTPYSYNVVVDKIISFSTAIGGRTTPGGAILAPGMRSVDGTADQQVGASLGAMLFGILGAVVGRFLAGRIEQSEAT